LKNPSTNPPAQGSLTIQRPTITDEKPTGLIEELRPTIQARIYSPLGVDIDLQSVEMKLDYIPVSYTPSGSGSDITISYTPASDLSDGEHTVTVNGRETNGLPSEKKEWSFQLGGSGDWEETWHGANFSESISYLHDQEICNGGCYHTITVPINVSGNHTWTGSFTGEAGIRDAASGSYAYINSTMEVSSEGIHYDVEVEAYLSGVAGTYPWAHAYTGYELLTTYISPPLRLTENSQLIWSGQGRARLRFGTMLHYDPWYPPPGIHSFASYRYNSIARIQIWCDPVFNAKVKDYSGFDRDSGSIYVGEIRITNVRQ